MKTTIKTDAATITKRLLDAELAGDANLLSTLAREARTLKMHGVARKAEATATRIREEEAREEANRKECDWAKLTPAEKLDALRNTIDERVDWLSFRSAEKTKEEMLKTFVEYATRYGMGDAIRHKGCEMFEFEAVARAKRWIREAIRGTEGSAPASVADLRDRLVKLKEGSTRRCIDIARESRGDRAGFEAIKDAAEAGAMARIPERIDCLLDSVDAFVAGKFCDPDMTSTSASFQTIARAEYAKAIAAGVVSGRTSGEAK